MNTSLDKSGNISMIQANRSLLEMSIIENANALNQASLANRMFIPPLQHPGLFPPPSLPQSHPMNLSWNQTDLTYTDSMLQNSLLMPQP
jgi:hypothetical protein